MHKRFEGIVSTWKLSLNKAHYCEIFIWDNHEHLRAANAGVEKNTCGRCEAKYVTNKANGKNYAGKKFAEIHLIRDKVGAGIVAHEIGHLEHYWAEFCGWTMEKDDEAIADFVGNFTYDFWNSWYERFDIEASHG